MQRHEIINRIIKSKGYKNYLEIGVRDGECFKLIECPNKTGVDPNPTSSDTTHIMTSDDYFSSFVRDEKFDIIFIDGLHIDHQVDKDIVNSLDCLKEGGTIVLHDCNPPTEYHALEYPVFTPPANGAWNGTVYLSIIKVRLYRKDLILKTVDSDWGVGILTRGESKTLDSFPDNSLNWDFFDENRKDILNIIDTETFKSNYPIGFY
jgi:hypothetical protein